MKKLRYWLKALPAGLAVKMRIHRTVTKWLKVPAGTHFSQTGEDMIIGHFFREQKTGFMLMPAAMSPLNGPIPFPCTCRAGRVSI